MEQGREQETQPYNVLAFLMGYEAGELNQTEILDGFQYLVDSGLAWQLQGHYGRTAVELIRAGEIAPRRA